MINKKNKRFILFINYFLHELRPERFFVCFASFFGLLVLFITPPCQSPDEINHFLRAYQISEGFFIAQKHDNRLGGYVPKSLNKITEPFINMGWNLHEKTDCKTICGFFKIPLNPEEKIFIDFPNTGLYSPVSYLPQSFIIFILRILNLPPLFIFYGARLFTLIFWIVSIFFAIKIIPFYKWFLTLIALLPMSLFIHMSISADVMTDLLSFLLIAYIFYAAFSDKNVYPSDLIIISILVAFLSSAKIVYTPIVLLILFIPKDKFKSNRSYYIQLSVIFLIATGTVLFWTAIINNLYIPYTSYNSQYRDCVTMGGHSDMYKQMDYILQNGSYFFQVIIHSMIQTFDMYFESYIGTFGWLDTKLPTWFIYSAYIVILIAAILDGHKNLVFNLFQRILLFFILLSVIFLVLLSQHLTWDSVGSDLIAIIQGRYFVPAFPFFFMLFNNTTLYNKKAVVFLVIIFSLVSVSLTLKTLYIRYYVKPEFESFQIQCDAETIDNNPNFKTNLPTVFLENGNTQTLEKARSGKYSAKLSPQKPFGFTYRLKNCNYGDVLRIRVWRAGSSGSIIISGDKDLYIGADKPVESDSSGWQLLKLNYLFLKKKEYKEVGIYLYYSGTDSAYFDDFEISYDKLR